MLKFAINIDVSARRLWEVLTIASERGKWWSNAVELDARVGGVFRECWHDGVSAQVTEGMVEQCVPSQFLTFTWRESSWSAECVSRVTFVFESEGLKSCLRICHEPLVGFTDESWVETKKVFAAAWAELLLSLKDFLHRCNSQSAHDLLLRAKFSHSLEGAKKLFLNHAFLGKAELVLNESSRLVWAWQGDGVHKMGGELGSTLALAEFENSGAASTNVRIVHSGFGFSREWFAAREWQDMAWQKFLAQIVHDEEF